MSWEKLNERPSRGLLSWDVTYRDEPAKGARKVCVSVWVPAEVAREGISCIADYLEPRFGWKIHRNAGWGSYWSAQDPDDGLMEVSVDVRAREIRAAKAAS